MKSATKHSYSEVSQVKMTQEKSNYWLRLLGDRHQVNGSAGSGHNGHQVGVAMMTWPAVMLDSRPDYWLRLLRGTGQPNHATDNGRIAKMAPQALGNQLFTPEYWLRLLGDTR